MGAWHEECFHPRAVRPHKQYSAKQSTSFHKLVLTELWTQLINHFSVNDNVLAVTCSNNHQKGTCKETLYQCVSGRINLLSLFQNIHFVSWLLCMVYQNFLLDCAIWWLRVIKLPLSKRQHFRFIRALISVSSSRRGMATRPWRQVYLYLKGVFTSEP